MHPPARRILIAWRLEQPARRHMAAALRRDVRDAAGLTDRRLCHQLLLFQHAVRVRLAHDRRAPVVCAHPVRIPEHGIDEARRLLARAELEEVLHHVVGELARTGADRVLKRIVDEAPHVLPHAALEQALKDTAAEAVVGEVL